MRFALLLLLLLLVACGRQNPPSVLFLRDGPAGTPQLYVQPPGDAPARALTGNDAAAPPVVDYAVSPDGRRILYSVGAAAGGEGGSALRLLTIGGGDRALLDCPAAECSAPVWSPDGRTVIYELRPWLDGLPGSPRLRRLDPNDGRSLPLIEGEETPAYGARFSPDGRWLSYVSMADEGVVLYRLADGQQRLLDSRVGSPAAWSPNSAEVVYGDIAVQAHQTAPEAGGAPTPIQESANIYLYRTIVAEDSPRQRLSPEAAVADSAPAFSPDGQWLAFGRAPAGTVAGRQLWLMRPDGADARPLTDDSTVSHGPPSWSPDGRYLLFQRYEMGDPAAVASVWRLDVATGEETLVAAEGYLPGWLP